MSVLILGLWAAPDVQGQADEFEGLPSEEITLPLGRGLKKDAPARTYFLIGPKEKAKAPKTGFGLLIVLPGGSGGRDFHPFVKRIAKHALGDDMLVAQPVAIAWERAKQVVWPTQKDAVKGRVTGTEVFVEDVITDVAKRQSIDPRRIYLMAWSSGGPAAYAISLQKRKSITGSFILMSVFKPDQMPSLKKEARGEAYYLLHGTDDRVCPYRMAQDAESTLKKAGARTLLRTVPGGHGWRFNVYGELRKGLAWLETNKAAADPKMWPKSRRRGKK